MGNLQPTLMFVDYNIYFKITICQQYHMTKTVLLTAQPQIRFLTVAYVE